MGYTRYWSRTDVPMGDNFIAEVNSILIDCAKKGIAIRNWDGKNRPEISKDRIVLNGNADYGLAHESFVIDNNESDFKFCKTARKPYDYAVREILRVAEKYCLVTNVSDDGDNEEIYSDEEYLLGLNDRSNWW